MSKKTPSRKVAPWEKTPTEKPIRKPVPYISSSLADWLADYLTTANRAVGGVLALREAWMGDDERGLRFGEGYLPLLICLVVLWARTELRIIDMSSLERLKMESKRREGGKMVS